jgi:hypothetical protein
MALTGRRPFEGRTQASVIGAVLERRGGSVPIAEAIRQSGQSARGNGGQFSVADRAGTLAFAPVPTWQINRLARAPSCGWIDRAARNRSTCRRTPTITRGYRPTARVAAGREPGAGEWGPVGLGLRASRAPAADRRLPVILLCVELRRFGRVLPGAGRTLADTRHWGGTSRESGRRHGCPSPCRVARRQVARGWRFQGPDAGHAQARTRDASAPRRPELCRGQCRAVAGWSLAGVRIGQDGDS